MTPLISVSQLKKSYPQGNNEVRVLRDINLSVEPGEAVAIMGASGSGKSTLLHILGCLDQPTSGTYLFDGQDMGSLSDKEASRIRVQKIGFVFQNFNLLPHFSILENVLMPLLYHTSATADETKGLELLKRVGLSHRTHHRPTELSGGEQQRAAIARALLHSPPLILADEPTGNLDSSTTRDILTLFSKLTAAGTTLIMVTHNPDVAGQCDRTLHMQDGEFLIP